MKKKIGVILFNLGGPDKLSAVKPFLFNLFNDPAIIGAPSFIRYFLATYFIKKKKQQRNILFYWRKVSHIRRDEEQKKQLENY